MYAAAPAYQQQQQQSPEERCAGQAKAFAECMSRNNADIGACQFYFESMQVGVGWLWGGCGVVVGCNGEGKLLQEGVLILVLCGEPWGCVLHPDMQ